MNLISFLRWLVLLFIGLKLTAYIDWSWWLVLAPYPISILLRLVVVAVCEDDE